ncbi:MAG: hypothetical protein M1831_000716 [Alyxoria varia]|nr:MAG: hypothetical protein M1831_000716 [Alyxoria varia]
MPTASDGRGQDDVEQREPQEATDLNQKANAATGASAAGIRAIFAQFIGFFRTRFDYTAFAREINPRIQSNERWSWRITTPGLLAHAIKEHGWGFIPNQVLPPMMANVTVGAILYTSYLQTLGALYGPASHQSKRVYPPPPVSAALGAGFAAGSIQSVVAAPLDALQVRFRTSDMLEGHYKSMWNYASHKLREIGPKGVFAGWSLSFFKDSLGFAVFFATFEAVKSQAYYSFVRKWYGDYKPVFRRISERQKSHRTEADRPTIKPHYTMEPTFLLLAGVAASVTQQVVQHPLTAVQNVHYNRLESLDYAARLEQPHAHMMRSYYKAYKETFRQCQRQASRGGGWRAWLYKGVLGTTVRQVPSTSAGLIVFELVRRRYSSFEDAVRIHKDGYDILLT